MLILEYLVLGCGLLFLCVAVAVLMKYHLHMFQLNGYKNGEHLHWIKKNRRQFYIIWLDVVLAAVSAVLYLVLRTVNMGAVALLPQLLLLFYLALTIWNYHYLNTHKTKKKLVYTDRVKRLVVTEMLVLFVVLALFAVLGYLVSWQFAGWLFVAAVLAGTTYLPVLANVINAPVEQGVNRYFVEDAKKLLAGAPELTIIGITGSYGKTSVKFYLKSLLEARYNVLMTPESYNTPMGIVRTIREHLRPDHEIFLCEMGARHVGDIREICDIVHPNHGVITSVGPQHLETFFSMENIVHTKFELAEALPEDGMLFLNGDCSYITDYCGKYPDRVMYSAKVSEKEASLQETEKSGAGIGYYAKEIRLNELGTEFILVAPDGQEEAFCTRLIGEHNVINIVGAAAVAHEMGIPLAELKIPVRRLQPAPHRLQMREQGNVTIIDDAYNSNPVGSKAAVETLALFDGVRILVTPGMVELGEAEDEFNYKFGTYAANCCDYVALVGERHTAPIRKGLLAENFDEHRIFVAEKLEEALQFAYGVKDTGHKYILLENDLPDNY